MLDKNKKNKIIKKYQRDENDTGSAQVQVAILTEEVKELQKHLEGHKKDFSSRRGLIRKVNQRHKLLNYLLRDDPKSYEDIIDKLKLKRRQVKLADDLRKIAETQAEVAQVEAAVESGKDL